MTNPTLSILPFLLLFFRRGLGNIIFSWVQPSCNVGDTGWNGCLRGQICSPHGVCYPSTAQASPVKSLPVRRALSVNGRCGPGHGHLLCDPNSDWYFGTCCSKHGWCGNTDAYCGSGCVANCTPIVLPQDDAVTASAPFSSTTRLAIGEPTLVAISALATASSSSSTAGAVTIDGTCGITHNGTSCGTWYKGSCCSMYGWCGNTTAHCGDGCQSGPCMNGSTVSAPGSSSASANSNPGSFTIVGQAGVPVMHAALMTNGRAVFLDKVENYTQLRLPNGQYAYSSEYDPATNQAVPLAYQTNAFCSGGIFLANGTLLNIGGNAPLTAVDPTVGDGFTALRSLTRSSAAPNLDGNSWCELGNKLNTPRWYASAQILPDGTIFVASGSLNGLDPTIASNNNPTYEILNAQGFTNGQSIPMDILEANQPYYMYPFLHLMRDGTLFVFVSKSAEQFNVQTQTTVQRYNDLPGDYRTYPNTGGSVLLPLTSSNNWDPDIVICGGGAYQDITSPTDASCGRIKPLSADPTWEMESMPEGRTMVEGTLLPDGTVVWLNGCSQGAQGFGLGASPAYEALIYDPSQPLGNRFTAGASSNIARLYHSTAFLLLDGTIMVAGSNPVEQPILNPDATDSYVTEFRVETYTPPYLSGGKATRRPTNITLSSTQLSANSSTFFVSFVVPSNATSASVVLYYGGFITHSLHMGHRMVVLDTFGWTNGATQQIFAVIMPPNTNVAPPGPYVVYVLCDGIPAIGQFVMVS